MVIAFDAGYEVTKSPYFMRGVEQDKQVCNKPFEYRAARTPLEWDSRGCQSNKQRSLKAAAQQATIAN